MQTITANGATIPVLGLGTWQLNDRTGSRVVEQALRLGYRHIDAALIYGNEKEVGEGLRASGVKREDIFVTTKVPPKHLDDRAFQRSVDRSLDQLGVDQVDLVLIHWPSRTLPVATTIASLNKAKARGATRHIGRALAAIDDPLARHVWPLGWGLTAALVSTMASNVFYLTMSFYYFYVIALLAIAAPAVFARRLNGP